MNLQLTLARAAARDAESKWKDHVRFCPPCSRASRARQWSDMCAAGTQARRELRDCRADVERERELAKLPAPGQEALW